MVELEGIQELRKEIDKIDERLIVLLNTRLELARRIGEIKRESNIPVLDEDREKEVLERAGDFKGIFREIIMMSKKKQG